mgnify:FL=1
MAKEEKFTFLSADGKTTISAVKWLPENGEYVAILQITHGMNEYVGRYKAFAEFLTENGFMVVGHDHLGHGDSVLSEEKRGYFAEEDPSDKLIEDMNQLRQIVQSQNKDVPYFMMGHSMGSYMLRKYLTKYNDNLRGAIIMGTGSVPDFTTKFGISVCRFLAKRYGWEHRSRLVEALSFGGRPYRRYDLTGKKPSNSWLTKDEEIVKSYYSNPKCTFKFTLNGYLGLMEAVLYDNQMENVKKVPKKLPIFLVSGQDDPVGDNGVGVKKVYDMYKEAGLLDITYCLYENDRHEILNETDREKVYADLLAWMKVRIDT